MKNRFSVVALACLIVAASSGAFAQDAAGKYEVKKMAVINLKKIMDESNASKSAQKEITDIKNKYIADIKAEEKKLQQRQKELAEQKKALSEEAFNKKVNEFRSKVESNRVDAAKKQKVVENAFMKSIELIRGEVEKIVGEIAQKNNIDVVVPTAQTIYAKQSYDITEEVLNTLNQRLTEVDININKDGDSDKAKTDDKSEKAAPAAADKPKK